MGTQVDLHVTLEGSRKSVNLSMKWSDRLELRSIEGNFQKEQIEGNFQNEQVVRLVSANIFIVLEQGAPSHPAFSSFSGYRLADGLAESASREFRRG